MCEIKDFFTFRHFDKKGSIKLGRKDNSNKSKWQKTAKIPKIIAKINKKTQQKLTVAFLCNITHQSHFLQVRSLRDGRLLLFRVT